MHRTHGEGGGDRTRCARCECGRLLEKAGTLEGKKAKIVLEEAVLHERDLEVGVEVDRAHLVADLHDSLGLAALLEEEVELDLVELRHLVAVLC